jgi:hypothetical protein
MLYDSTKNLLQTILRGLQTADENRWDDQIESGNACLYEMHQMSGSLYKPYKPDRLNHHSQSQRNFPEQLARAIPHVRMMVIAIRHKNQRQALESGRAALAEMNSNGISVIAGGRTELATDTSEPSMLRHTGKHGLMVERRRTSRLTLASSGA